jgi:carbon-monoxide dehydrogenase medium subunit
VKPSPFHYLAPANRTEALEMLDTDGDARALAGGQSLVPMLAMRVLAVETLVDLNGVADLFGIEERGDTLHLGAMTRQRHLERSPVVAARCPMMVEALAHVGHRQTRNRGTLGGSLVHLDPAAELPAVAMALDATVHLESARGAREIPMRDFPVDLMTPEVAPEELLTAITVPCWPPGHGHAFVEFARRRGDFAIAAVAALLDVDHAAGELVRRAAVVVAGTGPIPLRCAEAESALEGSRADDAFAEAAEAAGRLEAMTDLHASAWYRQHLARTLTRRALDIALDRARRAART